MAPPRVHAGGVANAVSLPLLRDAVGDELPWYVRQLEAKVVRAATLNELARVGAEVKAAGIRSEASVKYLRQVYRRRRDSLERELAERMRGLRQ